MQINQIILVEDNQIFRKGLTLLLNELSNAKVIAEASNGIDFLQLLYNGVSPDLVFMDIKMPEMDGLEATEKAIKKYPDLKIVALTMFAEKEYIVKMSEAGAVGFIPKNIEKDELEKVISIISAGGNYFSKELLGGISNISDFNNNEKENQVTLTRREEEVLQLLCEGLSTIEIADKLFISQRTVEIHRASLLSKTNSKNSVSLVIYAIKKMG